MLKSDRPRVAILDPEHWAEGVADVVQANVEELVQTRGSCSLMLTGGRAAARLYRAWAEHARFEMLQGLTVYWGDERCVSKDHPDSNYRMAEEILFPGGSRPGWSVVRMEAERPDLDRAVLEYDHALPDAVDLLLLGVGEDGHIASLFPGSSALRETRRRVTAVETPKPPYRRMTVTPPVIANASRRLVLAPGRAKAEVLRHAIEDPSAHLNLPATLALAATWFLEDSEPDTNDH